LQARYTNHGWLTPAALHCMSGCRCRYGLSIRSSVSSPRLAYASRSWLHVESSVRNAQFAMYSRTWNKSGGRQPAVGAVTQLQRRSCTDDRRVAPVRRLSCCRYKRVSETTAGLRQPLLVVWRLFGAKCAICGAQSNMEQERRASARRGFFRDALAMHRERCLESDDCRTKSGGREPAVDVVERM
jgi:hypothetical protein